MKNIKSKFSLLFMMLSLLFIAGCVSEDASKDASKQLFIYQEGADFDTSIPMGYQLYPTTDQVIIIWNEGAKSHSTDLLVFEEDDTTIQFRYSNKAGENVTKNFEILSDSVVVDEIDREYQWFGEEVD